MNLKSAMRSLGSVGLLLMVVACGGGSSDETGTAPVEPGANNAGWRIGMSQCNLGEPWRVQMNQDIKTAADRNPDMTVIFKDAQNDSLKQRSQMEEFINDGMDLIIISPKEAAPLTPVVADAYRKGIPVIVLDRAVLGDQYTTFIGADNNLIGQAAGEWIAKSLGGKGKVVELTGLMTSVPGHDRQNGFRAGIAGTAIEIVFQADMEWLEPKARSEMESALAVNDHIDLVYAHNDPGAHGAYLAALAAGREKEMMFVGIDGLPQEGQAYVRDGVLNATFLYPTGGSEAIELARQILTGGDAPKKVLLNSRIFTQDNIAAGGEALIFDSATTATVSHP